MCGIAGLWHFDNQKKVNEPQLVLMRDTLAHRGPDDAGIFIDGPIGLAHRRLSIIDLSPNGHQPFHSENGRYTIVYNGEIYNYREFYPELVAKGYRFRSHSDTEVLLNLFEAYGPSMLDRLNGMFAFAIWDSKKKELFLARDRMGIKPLYYAFYNNSFLFASEPKALFKAGLPLQIADEHWDEFLLYRFVAGENTLFKGVFKLLPGHYATVKNGTIEKLRWWNLGDKIRSHPKIKQPVEWFRDTFDDSLRYRMISDVPVGVLLSGGLDSGSVTASLYHCGFRHIHTFNMGFGHPTHDESLEAQELSEKYDFPFHSIRLENDALLSKLSNSTYFADEPLVHLNDPHLLAVSKLAKQHVSVLLSGEGADEVLGGYVRYRPLKYRSLFPLLNALLKIPGAHLSGHRLDKLKRYLKIGDTGMQLLLNSSNSYPDDFRNAGISAIETHQAYRKCVLDEAVSVFPSDPIKQILYLDQHTYLCSLLDRVDRTSMGASIECREPFLDYRLVEGIGTLPSSWLTKGKKGKYLLKKAMADRLPASVLTFRKVGLSVPWNDYLRQAPSFKAMLQELPQSPIFEWGILRLFPIRKLIAEFKAGDNTHAAIIQQLLMIQIWQESYVKKLLSTQDAIVF